MTKTIYVAYRHIGLKCRKCEIELVLEQEVIATRGVNKTNYYHKDCYSKLFYD